MVKSFLWVTDERNFVMYDDNFRVKIKVLLQNLIKRNFSNWKKLLLCRENVKIVLEQKEKKSKLKIKFVLHRTPGFSNVERKRNEIRKMTNVVIFRFLSMLFPHEPAPAPDIGWAKVQMTSRNDDVVRFPFPKCVFPS